MKEVCNYPHVAIQQEENDRYISSCLLSLHIIIIIISRVLLSSQNSVLAEEYLSGVWAHESSIIEVGGLVCRMPLDYTYRYFIYNRIGHKGV